MERKAVKFDVKASDKAGVFSGYAAMFGNVDSYGDVILPGAIKEMETNEDGRVVLLPGHDDSGLPIGSALIEQDETGLKFDAELLLEDPLAARYQLHLKRKTLTGMSIGYSVLEGGAEFREDGVRLLSAIKIWEISPVVFPANTLARVTDVKHAQSIKTRTDFERFLRNVGGFSHSQAKALSSAWSDGNPRNVGDAAEAFQRTLSGFKIN